MYTVNYLSSKPLHQQIKQILERQILQKELEEGELIPSEKELCEQFGVSSTTVRRALHELVRDGLIYRRPGIGSFVSSAAKQLSLLLLVSGFDDAAWHANLFGELIGGIAKVTWEHSTTLSVVHVPPGFKGVRSYLYSVIEEDVFDGILLRVAGDLEEDYLVPLLETGCPYVAIKRYLPHREINCVVHDDLQGAFRATEHLIKLGHTRIGLIASQHTIVGRDRSQGYFKALEAYEVDADPSLIRYSDSFREEEGHRATSELLSLEERPTAVFAASDRLAVGAYRAIEETGLRIPEDVAIVGYGDIPPIRLLSPPLTTVRLSYRDLGIQSVSLLLDIITHKVRPPQRVVIESSLIVRESSRAGKPNQYL
jgi:LacI family repressor for deo operon, udp, cdd, tsx, nupC, and nupG